MPQDDKAARDAEPGTNAQLVDRPEVLVLSTTLARAEAAALSRACDAVNMRLAMRPLDNGLETELPILVELLKRLKVEAQPDPSTATIDAIASLLDGAQPVNLTALQALRQQLSLDIWQQSPTWTGKLVRLTSRGSPVFCTLLGAGTSAILALAFLSAWTAAVSLSTSIQTSDIVVMRLDEVAPLCMTAILGAIASIATRMEEFSKRITYHPMHLLLNGVFKTLLSVLFAVIVYSILKSGLVQIAGITDTFLYGDRGKVRFFIWIVGFLCGFSERFAYDLVSRVEGITNLPIRSAPH